MSSSDTNLSLVQAKTQPVLQEKFSCGSFDYKKVATPAIAAITTIALGALAVSAGLMIFSVINFSLPILGILAGCTLAGLLYFGSINEFGIQAKLLAQFIAVATFAHPQVDEFGCFQGTTQKVQLAHFDDKKLSDSLVALFTKEKANNADLNVVDLGCGNGTYVKALLAAGINAKGFDGNPDTCKLTKDDQHFGVLRLDQENATNDLKADWAISLEVGEHIPPQHMTNYLHNVMGATKKGVIISWALPGQGGQGHVNELPNEQIKNIFSENGFENKTDLENQLRNNCSLPWFQNTIMVFERKNS